MYFIGSVAGLCNCIRLDRRVPRLCNKTGAGALGGSRMQGRGLVLGAMNWVASDEKVNLILFCAKGIITAIEIHLKGSLIVSHRLAQSGGSVNSTLSALVGAVPRAYPLSLRKTEARTLDG